jgi:hypothetical protein
MTVNQIKPLLQQLRAADDAVLAYVDWRAQCTRVRDEYRRWSEAGAADVPLAYEAYHAALDTEEAAANVYARLMSSVGHLVESGLD